MPGTVPGAQMTLVDTPASATGGQLRASTFWSSFEDRVSRRGRQGAAGVRVRLPD